MDQEIIAATMAGAFHAVQETEKVRAVYTRFLDLRRDQPTVRIEAHAEQAIREVGVLSETLRRVMTGEPAQLPANGEPGFNTGHG